MKRSATLFHDHKGPMDRSAKCDAKNEQSPTDEDGPLGQVVERDVLPGGLSCNYSRDDTHYTHHNNNDNNNASNNHNNN